MKWDGLQGEAGAAERLIKAMASEPRLRILCALTGGERTVGELQASVGLAMSAVSQHLARLRAAGIVSTRRQGQAICYSLASDAAKEIMAALRQRYGARPASSKLNRRKTS